VLRLVFSEYQFQYILTTDVLNFCQNKKYIESQSFLKFNEKIMENFNKNKAKLKENLSKLLLF
jgi:hypothetical protein